LEEVLPLGGVNDRELIDAIADRYAFLKRPDLAKDDTKKDGYKFASGGFSFNSSTFRIGEFSIFSDGLVVNAIATDGSEAFLDDVINFAKGNFGFRDFETSPKRYFLSQIVVEFDHSPEKLLKLLDVLESIISTPLERIFGMAIPMKFARLDFGFDKTSKPNPSPAIVQNFVIERRAGISFEKERYFCAAPMRTAEHTEVLVQIEKLFD
jgi:hypothetical protein